MERRSFLAMLGLAAAGTQLPITPIRGKRRIDVEDVEALIPPAPVIPKGDFSFRVGGIDFSDDVLGIEVEHAYDEVDASTFGGEWRTFAPATPAKTTIRAKLLGSKIRDVPLTREVAVELGHKSGVEMSCWALVTNYTTTARPGSLVTMDVTMLVSGPVTLTRKA